MNKVHLKLKEGKMPQRGAYTRHVGGFHFTVTDYKAKEFELANARVALGTGDFELSDPENPPVIAHLPDDFPERELLIEKGFLTVESVSKADDPALLDIDGIGAGKLAKIRKLAPFTEQEAHIFDPTFPIETATTEGETE